MRGGGQEGGEDPDGTPDAREEAPGPKRSLSQNFLIDPNLQRKIVDALGAPPDGTVLEVGAGHGELSRHLVGRVALLVLVEKDDRLARELTGRWGGRDDVRVVHDDALEVGLLAPLPSGAPYRILSNLPYAVTSPLLFRFLSLDPPAERIVVTVQKEVGERLAAAPGSKAYGSLTVGVQARAAVELLFPVSRHAFRPVPDVDSVTVAIQPERSRIEELPDEALRRLTRAAFGRRRKQLQKILRSAPEYALERQEAEAVCQALGVDPRTRPERLGPDQFVELARRLESRRGGASEPRAPGDEGRGGGAS